MNCRNLRHFIWVINVCKSTRSLVYSKQSVNSYFIDLEKMRDLHIFACNKTDCSDKMYIHRDYSNPVPEYLEVPLPDIEARCIGLQLLGEDRNLIFFQVQIFGGKYFSSHTSRINRSKTWLDRLPTNSVHWNTYTFMYFSTQRLT